jgi:S1-C subfamily serine protease
MTLRRKILLSVPVALVIVSLAIVLNVFPISKNLVAQNSSTRVPNIQNNEVPDQTSSQIKHADNVSMSSSYLTRQATDSQLPQIFKQTENSVVQITSTRPSTNSMVIINGKQIPQNDVALGSGFVYDQQGHIVTNYHVVADSNQVDVTFVDGDTFPAKVIGKDPYSDLAILQITDNSFSQKHVSPLKIANSTSLEVGEQVIAIGNPFGLSGTLTTGVVSQVGRLLPNDITGYSIANTIQTDAPINPGNSGGPLLNINGEVIGMNTAIFSANGVYSGVGFAIPSNMILKEIPVLIEKGSYSHPWIGFTASDVSPEIAQSLGLPRNYKGAMVVSVVDQGPAQKAGLRGEQTNTDIQGAENIKSGDIITKIDGHTVKRMDDVITYLEDFKSVGDTVKLSLNREGKNVDMTVVLEERPSTSPRLLSVSEGQDKPPAPDNPFPFKFPEIPGFPWPWK